mmetsp:Transcript_27332/g.81994  ORF Transcript_27332/g.81994 Transcript_27332/m.81994 type:complete len:254 (-) Transcript_27332:387-1148(-)
MYNERLESTGPSSSESATVGNSTGSMSRASDRAATSLDSFSWARRASSKAFSLASVKLPCVSWSLAHLRSNRFKEMWSAMRVSTRAYRAPAARSRKRPRASSSTTSPRSGASRPASASARRARRLRTPQASSPAVFRKVASKVASTGHRRLPLGPTPQHRRKSLSRTSTLKPTPLSWSSSRSFMVPRRRFAASATSSAASSSRDVATARSAASAAGAKVSWRACSPQHTAASAAASLSLVLRVSATASTSSET